MQERGMQEMRDAGKEGCRKRGMTVRRKEGIRTGGIQERWDSGQEGFRTGGIQETRDTGNKGYRK